MSVTYKQGVGFSDNALYMDIEALANPSDENRPIEKTVPVVHELFTYTLWAPWGAGHSGNQNNLLPNQMIKDIETCGILNSIIDSQARFALGEGVIWGMCKRDDDGKLIIEKLVDDQEILDFMEDNNHYVHELGWMRDKIGFNNGVVRFMLDKECKKIAAFQRDDVTEMRYQKMDPRNGNIYNIFLSAEWDKVFLGNTTQENVEEDSPQIVTIPLLDQNFPYRSIQQFAESKTAEFAMTLKYPSWGKKYYAMPLWFAALQWVKVAQSVPEMKKALFKNSITPKYQVIIYEEYWQKVLTGEQAGKAQLADYTPEQLLQKKIDIMNRIDKYLTGTDNAYKSVFTDGWYDRQAGKQVPFIEIKPIEDPASSKNDNYLPTSATANSEIAFAMRFNPSIFGSNLPSGPYTNSQGGSSIREAVATQIISLEPERQDITRIYKLISKFNGWDKRLNKNGLTLQPIIPATILTTLDTGSGTKPVMTGAQPGEKNNTPNPKNNNGTN